MDSRAQFEDIFEKIMNKTANNAKLIRADFPKTAHGSKYEITDEIHDWTNGFWPGLMWLLYLAKNDDAAKDIAVSCENRLDEAFIKHFSQLGHDVGFVYTLTSCIHYEKTQNPDSLKRIYAAATALAARFNLAGRYIRSWNDLPDKNTSRWTIADNMMNLPLLYRASKLTKDPRFYHVATAHAETMQKYLLRSDGSANHIICFHPETGENEPNEETAEYTQGRDTTSCWTRGNAWVICGFTYCYSYTKKTEFLEAAKKSARFFLSHLPKDRIPPIDFCAPLDGTDTSAGAIAASGMIELAKYVQNDEKKEFLSGAEEILLALDAQFADYSLATQPILSGGATRYHGEGMRNVSLIYGDFYYAEAIFKLLGGESLFC